MYASGQWGMTLHINVDSHWNDPWKHVRGHDASAYSYLTLNLGLAKFSCHF